MINAQELNVCAIQSSSLPQNNLDHPAVGQRVRITRGPLKSYYGLIKDIGPSDATVEIDAHLISRSSPRQNIPWINLVIVYVCAFIFWFTISLIRVDLRR